MGLVNTVQMDGGYLTQANVFVNLNVPPCRVLKKGVRVNVPDGVYACYDGWARVQNGVIESVTVELPDVEGLTVITSGLDGNKECSPDEMEVLNAKFSAQAQSRGTLIEVVCVKCPEYRALYSETTLKDWIGEHLDEFPDHEFDKRIFNQ